MFLLKVLKEGESTYNITENLKDIHEVKLYVEELLKYVLNKKGKRVKIINVIKNEVNFYKSKREGARHIKADTSSIYNRNKLFRSIYKI